MRTISFYSFKGGVGRSSLVVNLAYEIARRGRFVVIADWDLHAPGLTTMDDLAMPAGPHPRKGILDFLVTALGSVEGDEEVEAEVIDPLQLAQPTRVAERGRKDTDTFGDLYFVPAGDFGGERWAQYPETLRQIRLPDLATWSARLGDDGAERSVLQFFRDRIAAARSPVFGPDYPPDYLFLDSRTGFTEIGDLLLGNPVDHYVVIFGLNEQNLLGVELVLKKACEKAKLETIADLFTLVASPVPIGEDDLLQARLAILKERLRAILRGAPGAREPSLPTILQIPYHPRMALREELMIERYPASGPAQAYQGIADHVLRFDMTSEQVRALTRSQVIAQVREDTPPEMGTPGRPPDPSPYDTLPPWNWPAPDLDIERVMPGEPKELRQRLLNGLAWSLSLPKEEKARILASGATMPAPRIALIAAPLEAERQGWRREWEKNWKDLQWQHASCIVDWLHLLEERGLLKVDGVVDQLIMDTGFRMLPHELAGSNRFLLLVVFRLLKVDVLSSAARLIHRVIAQWNADPIFHPFVDEIRRLADPTSERSGEWKTAFERSAYALLQATEIDPEDSRTLLNALFATTRNGWNRTASELAHRVTSAGPLRPIQWRFLSRIYAACGQRADAEAAIRKALELEPHNADWWRELGGLLEEDRSRLPDAEAAFSRATELNSHPSHLRNLARFYATRLKLHREAEHAMNRAIAMSSDADLLIEDASFALMAGDERRAVSRLNSVHGFFYNPNDRDVCAVLRLALALRQLDHDSTLYWCAILQDGAPPTSENLHLLHADALLSTLDALPETSLKLLRAALDLAAAKISREEFGRAVEAWRAVNP